LVGLKADVIVTVNDPMTRAAKAVTDTVPIVMTSSIDPVGSGLVQSLARPGGKITGLAVTISPEVEAKRLELLREMLPRVSRVAYLDSQVEKTWGSPRGRSVRTAAQALGVTLLLAEATPHQYAEAFTVFRRTGAEALLKGASPADLPVEQPTTFELVIDMKTVKDLGLSIPQTILLQADQVIE
jgi:putative ABC transport system substrate-binding protein